MKDKIRAAGPNPLLNYPTPHYELLIVELLIY